jgi:hypothetical protein
MSLRALRDRLCRHRRNANDKRLIQERSSDTESGTRSAPGSVSDPLLRRGVNRLRKR